jgi:acetyl-CoA carboxylase alpha subunit
MASKGHDANSASFVISVCPNPRGFTARALRLMEASRKNSMEMVTLIILPGAFPDLGGPGT